MGEWRRLLDLLSALGVREFISPDLGIVRGLAYYTGFVFEAFQTVGTGRALAGGGRYDNLVGKLGYQDMPAVGFGMGDVTVSDLLELVGKGGSLDVRPDAYVAIGSPECRAKALETVASLRRAGLRVDYPLRDMPFGKQFKQADSAGARFAVAIGPDEISKNRAKVKNLSTRRGVGSGFRGSRGYSAGLGAPRIAPRERGGKFRTAAEPPDLRVCPARAGGDLPNFLAPPDRGPPQCAHWRVRIARFHARRRTRRKSPHFGVSALSEILFAPLRRAQKYAHYRKQNPCRRRNFPRAPRGAHQQDVRDHSEGEPFRNLEA